MAAYNLSARDEDALDRVIWSALTSRHQSLALGNDLARRYPPTMAPFAAVAAFTPEAFAELRSLAAADPVALKSLGVLETPEGFDVQRRVTLRQMISAQNPGLPSVPAEILEAQAAKADEAGNEVPPLRGVSEEAIVAQIRALTRGETLVINANLPNRGQLDGFAPGTIVETNVVFSGTGIRPVYAGRLPPAVEALVKPQAERQNALVKAVLAGDRETLETLFLTDPLVSAIGPDRGIRLFRSMVAATSHCLPEALRLAS